MLEKRKEEFIEDLREEFSFNNKRATDWYDENKFNEILTTIHINNFSHKNKIGKFKFNDINALMNNIKNKQLMKQILKRK